MIPHDSSTPGHRPDINSIRTGDRVAGYAVSVLEEFEGVVVDAQSERSGVVFVVACEAGRYAGLDIRIWPSWIRTHYPAVSAA